MLRVTILGCGSSPGVPRIGSDWGACDPAEPKNRRLRCSILLERIAADGGVTRVLVDTGPDIRAQLLAAGVGTLDGVVYTHSHADHTHGIDDLRSIVLNMHRLVNVYGDTATLARLNEAFGYCFQTAPGSSYPPILQAHTVTPGTPFAIDGAGGAITVTPFRQIHGDIETLGLRAGALAYSCDVSALPEASLPALADLDVWIVDALRYTPHPSHFSLSETLAWIDRLRPRHAVLTHMHLDLDYQTVRREVPATVEPAYDGLQMTLEIA
jgi:phosphoribosyl 1,2-cyclic phosphate phosphodiesterase